MRPVNKNGGIHKYKGHKITGETNMLQVSLKSRLTLGWVDAQLLHEGEIPLLLLTQQLPDEQN